MEIPMTPATAPRDEAMIASVGRLGKKCLARIGSTAARIDSHNLRDFILSDMITPK
jgi:hypothetical protein